MVIERLEKNEDEVRVLQGKLIEQDEKIERDAQKIGKFKNQLSQSKSENQEYKNKINELEQDVDALKYALKDHDFFGSSQQKQSPEDSKQLSLILKKMGFSAQEQAIGGSDAKKKGLSQEQLQQIQQKLKEKVSERDVLSKQIAVKYINKLEQLLISDSIDQG